jgi:hypothetical protein
MTVVNPLVMGKADEVTVAEAPVRPLEEAVTLMSPGVEEARTEILLMPHSTGKLVARM